MKSCQGKKTFRSWSDADGFRKWVRKVARQRKDWHGGMDDTALDVYRCEECGEWHLGRNSLSEEHNGEFGMTNFERQARRRKERRRWREDLLDEVDPRHPLTVVLDWPCRGIGGGTPPHPGVTARRDEHLPE